MPALGRHIVLVTVGIGNDSATNKLCWSCEVSELDVRQQTVSNRSIRGYFQRYALYKYTFYLLTYEAVGRPQESRNWSRQYLQKTKDRIASGDYWQLRTTNSLKSPTTVRCTVETEDEPGERIAFQINFGREISLPPSVVNCGTLSVFKSRL